MVIYLLFNRGIIIVLEKAVADVARGLTALNLAFKEEWGY